MSDASFEIKGLKELQESLKELPGALALQCVREGLRRGGEALRTGMAERAPVAARHRVYRGGRAYPIPLHEAMRARVTITDRELAVSVGPARVAFWGLYQELGTRYMAGRHFMAQTLEQDGQIAVAALATGCRDRFDATVRRLNRKAG